MKDGWDDRSSRREGADARRDAGGSWMEAGLKFFRPKKGAEKGLETGAGFVMIRDDSGGGTFLQRDSPSPPPWRLSPESPNFSSDAPNCQEIHSGLGMEFTSSQ